MKMFDLWGRRVAQAFVGTALAVSLVACGGGGGSAGTPVVGPGSGSSSPTGGGSTVTAADLVVVLNKNALTDAVGETLTATITSIDANRAAIGGAPVSFSIDSNAVVTPAGTTTDGTTGMLTATITRGSDVTPRPVKLTVTSGSVSKVVTFNVVQSAVTTDPQASDLSLTLSAPSVDNTGSRTITATATAVDQNRNALAGIPIRLTVTDASATILVSGTQTDASGKVTGTVDIGQNRADRPIAVVATSGTLSRTVAFQVTGTQFTQATIVPSVVAAGATGSVQYKLADAAAAPMAGVSIAVSGNGITSATGTTDLNGDYTFRFVAPNAPGTRLTIKAVGGGKENNVEVPIASGNSTQVPAAATPAAKTLNLSADVVSVNTDTTSNQISINAFFRDVANAPVPNVRVMFGVTGDNLSGTVGSGTNTVLSDAGGSATTTYRPGAVSSPTNGVTVRACWKTSDFAPTDTIANCPAGNLMTTTLTIVANPVSISIGTDATIGTGAGGLTYVKKFVVMVVDSAGNPKADVQITPSVDLGGYGKGFWEWNAGPKKWERAPDFGSMGALTAICPNEDLNRNGVIDTGEDVNGSKQLDPRKSDVSIAVVGATKTDATGIAVLQLEYPANIASWVKYKITVTAAGVLSPPAYFPLGTPVTLPSLPLGAVNAFDYLYTYDWLPVSAAAVAAESPPAFVNGLYGVSGSCADTR
ncbi:hypothetical protein ACG02S_20165 [Roseateles sp. DC23W]|uniref:Ig-like domain (Group 1) n=1 Tax=Pelomonas dachongensis TaxID=3299029 RepID=A0ABW7ETR0_9BURK